MKNFLYFWEYPRKTLRLLRREGFRGLYKKVKISVLIFKSYILYDVLSRRNKKQLMHIFNTHQTIKGTIIFLSGLMWDSPLFQRPHQLALGLSGIGYLSFYCDRGNVYDDFGGFLSLRERLYITSFYNYSKLVKGKKILYFNNMNTLIFAKSFEKIRKDAEVIMIYDCVDIFHMDMFCSLKTSNVARENYEYLIDNSDIILCSADEIYNTVRKEREKDVYLIPNAADYFHFHIERNHAEIPEDIKPITNKGNPIIGYYGSLAKWIDYELINFFADRNPNIELVLIGFDYDRSIKTLRKLKNIHYITSKPYNILPRYAVWFDVTMIPFVVNEITQATSPIKLFEYMALGKPTVSTNIRECQKYKSVFIAKDKMEFLNLITQALKLRDNKNYLRLLERESKENTWQVRVEKIDKILREKMKEKAWAI